MAAMKFQELLGDILQLEVRRPLMEGLLHTAVKAAASAVTQMEGCSGKVEFLTEYEEIRLQAGKALGLQGKATPGRINHELVSRGCKELARDVDNVNRGRRAAAHPVRGMAEKVAAAVAGKAMPAASEDLKEKHEWQDAPDTGSELNEEDETGSLQSPADSTSLGSTSDGECLALLPDDVSTQHPFGDQHQETYKEQEKLAAKPEAVAMDQAAAPPDPELSCPIGHTLRLSKCLVLSAQLIGAIWHALSALLSNAART